MESEPKISAAVAADLERFVADGNEAVEMKMIRTIQDIGNDKLLFKPEMCHQIFNEGETIFGYENLKIKLYFTAGSLKTFMDIKYTKKVDPKKCDGVDADNIVEKLETIIPAGYMTNLDVFSGLIDAETQKFRPAGEQLRMFSKPIRNLLGATNNGSMNGHTSHTDSTFEIYKCDNSVPHFVEYLKKMESFVLWFIDAASFLDAEDDKWKFFVMYEKYKTSEGNWAYAFVGYSAVYNFYVYPENIRPRIAQMMILPIYQKMGLGVELLSTIYQHYRTNPKVIEITVEDPSDSFERLRDFVDARDCKKLTSYSSEKLKKGFTSEMATEAKATLKMTKRQAHRMCELLRLDFVDRNNAEEFKSYRLDVKHRLNIPYQKQQNDITRLRRKNAFTNELQNAASLDDASRKTELESNYQLVLDHYQTILKRLHDYE